MYLTSDILVYYLYSICYPASTQYSGNICWVFPQRCNVPNIQRTFREHFKRYILVIFVLKMYDLTIINVDLLAISSNHKLIFPECSKNILRISVSKIFQECPWIIVRLWKYVHEAKKLKKMFCALSCGIFNIGSLPFWNVFLKIIETVFHLQ